MTVREDFLSTGNLLSWTPRPLILDSWLRCRTLRVNPSWRCAPLAVARETQLAQLREENAALRQAALPVIEHMAGFLADSGYVVVLSNAQGYLLDVVGDRAIRRRLEHIDFIPGGNWSESAAGTNAIGTALADGHVVQLMAAEHYCDGWQDLTCTASPIRHPLTNKIIGILDVTGNYRLIRPFLTSFLANAALEIQQRLHAQLLAEQHQQRYHLVMHVPNGTQSIKINIRENYHSEQRNEHSLVTPLLPGKQTLLDPHERRANDAERLVAAAGIVSASLDLKVTLDTVIEQIAHLLHVKRVGVYLFGEQANLLSMHVLATQAQQVANGEDPHLLVQLLKHTEACILVRERGEPVVIDDVASSTLLPPSFLEQTGIRSIMLLPMVTARGVSGFITVAQTTPHQWAIEDIRLGLAFASQSATAIENARLFDTLQQHNRHIETLNAVARILSTLPDPSQHLDLVLQRITEILTLDAGMILLLDAEGEHFHLAARCRLAESLQLDLNTFPMNILRRMADHVLSTREPLLMNKDECEDITLSRALHHIGFYTLLAIPLTTNNAVLGVLFIGKNSYDDTIREDLQFFSTVGQQLGMALRNAQLLRSAGEMEALRTADRLKSGFLAAVSHDLRSPLTAIRASVESLLDTDGVQSAPGKEHLLHNIAGQAHRLDQLVNQLLDLSRIEAGVLALDCDWTELPALISDTAAEFERLHTGCRIELIFDPLLPLYYVDPDRLLQVLWNLLENAYKYAYPSMPICVEARLVDNEILISVADRGPGIPRGEHTKIFQHFYRLARDKQTHTQGSGLGLAICRGIVEAHHGRIWVEDQEGGGSIFFVALPFSASGSAGLELAEAQELLA